MRRWMLVCLLCSACGTSLYNLPAPPKGEQQRDTSMIPGEDEREATRLYLEVRARALELNNLLATQRFTEAGALMSFETRDFLAIATGAATLEEALAASELRLPDGTVAAFDPVPSLLAEDVSKLSDEVRGVPENETSSRKEIFATLPDGTVKRMIFIFQGGTWVLHRTRLAEPITPPK